MKRTERIFLTKWQQSVNRNPLIIKGARQTGKTWLVRDFARRQYHKSVYINFDTQPAMGVLFEGKFDIHRFVSAIQIETGIKPEPGNTLLIFDEIQECPGAMASLDHFRESAPGFHVIATSSLPIACNHPISAGTQFLELHPLNFREFLEALDEVHLLHALRKQDLRQVQSLRSAFIDRLRQDYFVGGMPEAVHVFIHSADLGKVREVQRQILARYQQDFSDHVPPRFAHKVREIWNSIPAHLARDNRKFLFSVLRPGGRANEYEQALGWLQDAGLVHKVNRVNRPGAFKLFPVDLGLLAAMAGAAFHLDMLNALNGASTEQYVLQHLLARVKGGVYYWSPENARSRIDFLVEAAGEFVPFEVMTNENRKARSLGVYREKFTPRIAVRVSPFGF